MLANNEIFFHKICTTQIILDVLSGWLADMNILEKKTHTFDQDWK